jgi:hypothetical protein
VISESRLDEVIDESFFQLPNPLDQVAGELLDDLDKPHRLIVLDDDDGLNQWNSFVQINHSTSTA